MGDENLLEEDEGLVKPIHEALRVTPFVVCPNCHRLLEFGTNKCSQCLEPIEEDYAFVSAAVVVHNTQACSLANTIKYGDPAAVIVLFAFLYAYFIDLYMGELPILFTLLILPAPVLWLLIVLMWFFRFGRFSIGDEEFTRAKQDMRASLKLWLLIVFVQLVALATLLL